MLAEAPIARVQELRERVAHLLALALRARENGNIELSVDLTGMALALEDAAIAIENAARQE
jgi:hypothetical protein